MQTIISPETRARLKREFHPGSKRGLIKMIVVIVIGIVLISYLGFDIRTAVEDDQTQANFSYLGQLIAYVWNAYLADIWAVVWNIVGPVFDFFWASAQNFDWNTYNGNIDDFVNNTPQIGSGN